MPIYEYRCEREEIIFQEIKSIKEYDQPVNCPNCGELAEKIPSLVAMQPDNLWHGHYHLGLDKHFNSRKDFNNYLKTNNLAVNEPGIVKQLSSKERAEKIIEKSSAKRREIIAKEVQDRMI